MTWLWIASYAILWVLMLLLIVTIVAMARQIGLLNRRVPISGAREVPTGPTVGSLAPSLREVSLDGQVVTLGVARNRRTLIVFVSVTCSVCDDLLPSLRSLARTESDNMDVIILSNNDRSSMEEYMLQHRLESMPVVAQFTREEEFGAVVTPYALAIDEQGIVRGKGLVNHIEHLESLVNALNLQDDEFKGWRSTVEVEVGLERKAREELGS